MPALRPRERRLLILAGLIAIGVAGYLYVVEPLIEAHASTRELVVARSALLVRQERLVARSEAYGTIAVTDTSGFEKVNFSFRAFRVH